ncbi:DUF2750 domain-containing protein [uncultured Dokdonia sp.]|uniref:DUF2750 domain-containing protein n=1 Tax=uncultured Dokdonia sp. TaxID=575653 RepID=UPI00261321E0|nr:DUF2750 domain-containing protein [uncultured Dokdonia sp.]
MLQDSLLIEKRHKRFIKTICKSEVVYVLKSSGGFATSSSTQYDDDDGNPIGLICFWAEKALAKSCIKGEWIKYKVIEISLVDFIENWCIGMENDNLLVGSEFDQNMFGFEAEPLELILDLINELNSLKKDLNFRKFEGINDLEQQIKDILK